MNTKIALITGGSRGLGKNSAMKLAEKGNDIIITYMTKKEEAHQVVSEIEAMGRKAVAIKLDVGDLHTFDKFLGEVSIALKEIFLAEKFDFLINNAGHGATIHFMNATEHDFDRFMNVHFKGVYFLCQKALPMMNDNGAIINFSSGTTRFTNPGYSMYASMKGAIEVFTKYLAKEVGPRGITVNVVAPGGIKTDFNNAAIANNPQLQERLAANTALGRVGQAKDIGGIVAFLCSEDGHWINGQRIEATGGVNL